MRDFKKQLQKIAPHWYIIGGWLLVCVGLYGYHLATGRTPDRVALDILGFEVYWYGVWITGGIALGAYVVSRLMYERGAASFNNHVPAHLQKKPLTSLELPAEIQGILAKRGLQTIGELLLHWGFDPHSLGLNEAGLQKTQESLAALAGVKPEWLSDAPWRQWNPEFVWSGIGWCLIPALIGARLYHVLTPSPSMAAVGILSPLDYFRNPYELINLRNGGLGIYGGIVGGLLGLVLFTRHMRLPLLAWADLAGVGVAVGQVFGRWGNFFNQELYGRPTTVPWAVTIEEVHRLPDYAAYSTFHPAFLYESLWNLLAFAVLITLARRYKHKLLVGDLMGLYLIFYGIGRILLETVRLDSRTINFGSLEINMAVATFVSLVIAAAMGIWIIVRHRRQTDDRSS